MLLFQLVLGADILTTMLLFQLVLGADILTVVRINSVEFDNRTLLKLTTIGVVIARDKSRCCGGFRSAAFARQGGALSQWR